MRMLAIVVLSALILAVGVSAQDLTILAGSTSYQPALEDLREVLAYGDAEDQAMALALRVPIPDKPGQWSEVCWHRYEGADRRGIFDLQLDVISVTQLARIDSGDLRPLLGLGGTAILMRRDMGLAETSNDWLWGFHGTAGMAWHLVPWLSLEARGTYLWSRQSTLGGTEYDLSDSYWSLSVGLSL